MFIISSLLVFHENSKKKIAEIEWTCEKLYMFINVNVDVLKDSLAYHGVRVQAYMQSDFIDIPKMNFDRIQSIACNIQSCWLSIKYASMLLSAQNVLHIRRFIL